MTMLPAWSNVTMKCEKCQVEWASRVDGKDCWACGEPGEQGWLKPALTAAGHYSAERAAEAA